MARFYSSCLLRLHVEYREMLGDIMRASLTFLAKQVLIQVDEASHTRMEVHQIFIIHSHSNAHRWARLRL